MLDEWHEQNKKEIISIETSQQTISDITNNSLSYQSNSQTIFNYEDENYEEDDDEKEEEGDEALTVKNINSINNAVMDAYELGIQTGNFKIFEQEIDNLHEWYKKQIEIDKNDRWFDYRNMAHYILEKCSPIVGILLFAHYRKNRCCDDFEDFQKNFENFALECKDFISELTEDIICDYNTYIEIIINLLCCYVNYHCFGRPISGIEDIFNDTFDNDEVIINRNQENFWNFWND